jgi:hypothetical protein
MCSLLNKFSVKMARVSFDCRSTVVRLLFDKYFFNKYADHRELYERCSLKNLNTSLNTKSTRIFTRNTRVWRAMKKSASNHSDLCVKLCELCGLRTNLKINTLNIIIFI